MGFAWKFLLPLAVFNLFLVALEKLWWTEAGLGDGIVFAFAGINIVASAAALYLWARFLGYKPERIPTRPRLVREAGGYVPAGDPAAVRGRVMEGAGVHIGFWALSILTLVAAGGVMVSRNLLHAVLFLIVAFIGVAGFFVLLSAEFIAMAQIVIYVGAISVLILFAIVLTPQSVRDNSETAMVGPAILLGVALAAVFPVRHPRHRLGDRDGATRASPASDLGRGAALHVGAALRDRLRAPDRRPRGRDHARPLRRRGKRGRRC